MKKKVKKIHNEKRMYVIIRGDLHPTYAMVQGGHALAEFSLEHPKEFKEWDNQYLIYLKVWNLIALKELLNSFYKRKPHSLNFSSFYEPDLDRQLTAIAIYDDGRKVKDLPLA